VLERSVFVLLLQVSRPADGILGREHHAQPAVPGLADRAERLPRAGPFARTVSGRTHHGRVGMGNKPPLRPRPLGSCARATPPGEQVLGIITLLPPLRQSTGGSRGAHVQQAAVAPFAASSSQCGHRPPQQRCSRSLTDAPTAATQSSVGGLQPQSTASLLPVFASGVR